MKSSNMSLISLSYNIRWNWHGGRMKNYILGFSQYEVTANLHLTIFQLILVTYSQS